MSGCPTEDRKAPGDWLPSVRNLSEMRRYRLVSRPHRPPAPTAPAGIDWRDEIRFIADASGGQYVIAGLPYQPTHDHQLELAMDGLIGILREPYTPIRELLTPHFPEPNPRNRRAIPLAVRAIVFARDEYRCVECSGTTDLTIDHVTPRSAGGSDDESNLQTLCRSCNSRKGARV